jgi:hypothetical protein
MSLPYSDSSDWRRRITHHGPIAVKRPSLCYAAHSSKNTVVKTSQHDPPRRAPPHGLGLHAPDRAQERRLLLHVVQEVLGLSPWPRGALLERLVVADTPPPLAPTLTRQLGELLSE